MRGSWPGEEGGRGKGRRGPSGQGPACAKVVVEELKAGGEDWGLG